MPFDGFHHLADHAVSQNHDGVAVEVGHVKGHADIVRRLLNGRGGVDQMAIVAVAAAAGGLIIVALRRLDGAEAGAAAHHVDDDAGKLRAAQVGDALLLERDSGGGGRGHDALAAAGSAIDHVDRRDLGFCLKEAAADLRQMLCEVLGDLILRGDRVAEKELTASPDRSLCNGLVAFPKFFLHSFLLKTAPP